MTTHDLPTSLLVEPADRSVLVWVSSVDHKKIGIMYMLTAMLFFAVGGSEALFIRLQLAVPNNSLLSPQLYNQLFTMHGTTMVFLLGMPVLTGFANYFVPLMIGARDVAFPRLNAFAFWLLPCGGFLLHYSFITGAAPDAGWFSYVPLSTRPYSSLPGVDYWIVGLLVLGIGSVCSAINIVATILAYRAPGMSLQRVPLFIWMVFVQSILIILALPALNSALVLLLADRWLDAAIFEPARGGNALLWQHFFWIFGHPEVYILILPAFGMISEVVPVFSRKPIYGYEFIAGSTVAIGLLSFGVWAHHMFAVGLGAGPDIFFAAGSMLIGIPTGIKIYNWAATMWGGSIRFTTAMCFAVAFLIEFVIGGLSGIIFAVVPLDWQTTDTYFVVAHFHYVLFGGTVFALFAATYYWFPKITGRLLNERIGRWNFWLIVLGMNGTFLVQHFLGLMGMPRRTYTYADLPGWWALNAISTAGAVLTGVGVIVFLWNVRRSLRGGEVAGPNPWHGFTLEWATTSPPPEENFDRVPPIRSRRPVWDLDHPDDPDWKIERTADDTRAAGVTASKPKLAYAFFIASEAMFFIMLLAAFVVLNQKQGSQNAGDSLDVRRTGLFTVALLASSATAWLAERALRRDARRSFFAWLGITIALGAVFLSGQAIEYAGLLRGGVTVSSSLFGSTFFTVTGFHGLHVLAGLVALVVVAATFGRRRADVFSAVSWYWHFVDVVWIAVFCIIYLGVLR